MRKIYDTLQCGCCNLRQLTQSPGLGKHRTLLPITLLGQELVVLGQDPFCVRVRVDRISERDGGEEDNRLAQLLWTTTDAR